MTYNAENGALREALSRVPSCTWHGHGAYPDSCWWCALNRVIPPAAWDDDPSHPEGFDCHGEPLSSGERCGRKQHAPYVLPPAEIGDEE